MCGCWQTVSRSWDSPYITRPKRHRLMQWRNEFQENSRLDPGVGCLCGTETFCSQWWRYRSISNKFLTCNLRARCRFRILWWEFLRHPGMAKGFFVLLCTNFHCTGRQPEFRKYGGMRQNSVCWSLLYPCLVPSLWVGGRCGARSISYVSRNVYVKEIFDEAQRMIFGVYASYTEIY